MSPQHHPAWSHEVMNKGIILFSMDGFWLRVLFDPSIAVFSFGNE